jgi:hypothetical protein
LRRVVLEKPDDPVDFLLKELKARPYVPPPAAEEEDGRLESEKAKFLDLRRDETKMELLRALFDLFDPKGTGHVARAQLLVAFRTQPGLLLERFPKHCAELPAALEKAECGNKEGKLSWAVFSEGLMEALALPGGL